MTSVSDALMGHALDGRYQVTQRLARGGMATVYRAIDTRLSRTVAVKVMHIGLGDDAEFTRKFDQEARSAARLSHPNVVSGFDQGHDEGRPFIVMEYVAGCTLRDVISRDAPMEPRRALALIEPVLGALAAAHEAGLVHRDVKPENVLISDRGQIKVADFGLAKAISAQSSTATAGLLMGTVSYLPPELVTSGGADARSDVYSTGILMYEMLTGRKPHTGESPIQVAYAHVHTDIPRPSAVMPGIPDYLDALVIGAASRNPDRRPHDARVLLKQLRRVQSALADDVAGDAELTQDLSPSLCRLPDGWAGSVADPADRETIAFVSSAETIRSGQPDTGSPDTRQPYTRQDSIRLPESATEQTPSVPLARSRPVAPARPDVGAEHDLRLRQDQRHRRRRGWIALLLVLVLAATAAYAGWYLTKGRFTSTPSLTAMTQTEATSAARAAGLAISFNKAFSETIPAGTVFSTNPAAGTQILDGGSVAAVVSQGPERYTVPKLVGLGQAAATDALANTKLVPGDISQKWSETVSAGVVIKASKDSGTKVKKGTKVNLALSKGPKPIPITSYAGRSANDAEAALKKAGFTVTVTAEHSSKVAAGLVLNQSPDQGSGKAGDTIGLTSSLGPVMKTVPNVRKMGTKAATRVMVDAGFTVQTRPVPVYHLGLGFVAYSDPKGGSEAAEGSTITLFVV